MQFETIQFLFQTADKISEITAKIEEFVKNQSNPLEERIWVWENCPEAFTQVDSCYMDAEYLDGTEVSWYDDFYVERYETVDCRELKERDKFSDWDSELKKYIVKEEEWKHFRQQCLDKGVFRFKFDW
jgi:hypothetical protein